MQHYRSIFKFFSCLLMNKNTNIFVGNIAEIKWCLLLMNERLKLDTNTLKTLKRIKMNIVLAADQREKNQFVESW